MKSQTNTGPPSPISDHAANVLRRAVAAIEAEPHKFDMNFYLRWHDSHIDNLFMAHRIADCGSVACLFGWIVALHPVEAQQCQASSISAGAAEIVGLDGDQAYSLAHVDVWPEQFEREYDEATTPAARAAVLRKRVEWFIATGE